MCVCHQFLSISYWSNSEFWSQNRIQSGNIHSTELDNQQRTDIGMLVAPYSSKPPLHIWCQRVCLSVCLSVTNFDANYSARVFFPLSFFHKNKENFKQVFKKKKCSPKLTATFISYSLQWYHCLLWQIFSIFTFV